MIGGLFSRGWWLQGVHDVTALGDQDNPCGSEVLPRFERRRANALATENLAVRAARQYFCELDWDTHPCALALQPELSYAKQLARAASEMPTTLQRRIGIRAATSRAPGYVPLLDLPRTDPDDTRLVSGVLRKRTEQQFYNVYTTGGANRVLKAFADFAAGGLRHESLPGVWTCEPDGPYYFFFAEFAWAALDWGVDEEFWLPILHGLISTQLLYVHAYFNSAHLARRTFQTATRDHQFAADSMPSKRTRELWTCIHATLSKDELEYESCRRAAEFFK